MGQNAPSARGRATNLTQSLLSTVPFLNQAILPGTKKSLSKGPTIKVGREWKEERKEEKEEREGRKGRKEGRKKEEKGGRKERNCNHRGL